MVKGGGPKHMTTTLSEYPTNHPNDYIVVVVLSNSNDDI